MKYKITFYLALAIISLLSSINLFSQGTSMNTTGAPADTSAILDISSTTKGLLIPRMTGLQRRAITNPAIGLMLYQTDGDSTGLWFYDGYLWKMERNNSWNVFGNAGTFPPYQFIGTTDAQPLVFKVKNDNSGLIDYDDLKANTSFGYLTLYGNNSGSNNTAMGFNSLFYNNSGFGNTAVGSAALYRNNGSYNTASGIAALSQNSLGMDNTAYGAEALTANSTGSYNTAVGSSALSLQSYNDNQSIWYGYNTAIGTYSLYYNNPTNATNGINNTAVGYNTLYSNRTGYRNTAIGSNALYGGFYNDNNTAVGYSSLQNNNSGFQNTAVGSNAEWYNNSGVNNTAMGYQALYNNSSGGNNTAIGYRAGFGAGTVSFTNCTFIGSGTYPTQARSNVTMLGNSVADAQCTDDNQVCIGNTAITQIRAQVTGITAYSDERFKTNVKDDVSGLDFIIKLKPVTYSEDPAKLHKIWGTPDSILNNIDHSDIQKQRFIGFLAQDVEKAANESGFDFPA
jgi:trimeric autotransporter adhesin